MVTVVVDVAVLVAPSRKPDEPPCHVIVTLARVPVVGERVIFEQEQVDGGTMMRQVRVVGVTHHAMSKHQLETITDRELGWVAATVYCEAR